jgi:hypothetical protein
MQPPESNEGWLAQLVYLVSVGLAGLVAWITQYRRGRANEEAHVEHHVILKEAEIADMRAVRALGPQVTRIAEQLQQTFLVVQDNHRIVEQNREILVILQKLDRAFAIEEEVKEKLRQQRIDVLLRAERSSKDED